MPETSTENQTPLVSESTEQLSESQTQESSSIAEAASGESPKRKMGEKTKYFISFCILLLGVAQFYGLYALKKPPEEQDSKELIPMVAVTKAMPYSGQLDKVISGTVVPFREIRVAAEISGNVVKKFDEFESGNFVKKGTKLIEIDPTDYRLQLKTGQAEVLQSERMLEETKEEIAGAKKNINGAQRDFKLANSDHQRNLRIRSALSSAELDQSKRALLAAETSLTASKNTLDMVNAKYKRMQASLALSKSKLTRTKLNLEKTVVVAPDDGVIVKEMIQEGDFVRAGDQLVMFEDISRSEVICNLTPTDLTWIRNNSPASEEFSEENKSGTFSAYQLPKTNVSIFDPNEKGVVWDGILERFDGIGRDEATRTIPCRVTIANPIVNTDSG